MNSQGVTKSVDSPFSLSSVVLSNYYTVTNLYFITKSIVILFTLKLLTNARMLLLLSLDSEACEVHESRSCVYR